MTSTNDPQWTILSVLNWTAERFASQGLNSARLDAEVLLAFTLGMERIRLYTDYDKPLKKPELALFRERIKRRMAGEPVAYIIGRREFWSLSLKVSREVLIPRPETELLVELGRARLAALENPTLVDVGTGSGAIALALGKELPSAAVWAIDNQAAALSISRQNAALHDVAVTFLQGDLLEALPTDLRPNLVLANLPYIPTAEIPTLCAEVREWEPLAALDGGVDGLDVIRRLIEQAARLLRVGAGLVLEVGYDQAARVSELLTAAGFTDVVAHKDLNSIERVVIAVKNSSVS